MSRNEERGGSFHSGWGDDAVLGGSLALAPTPADEKEYDCGDYGGADDGDGDGDGDFGVGAHAAAAAAAAIAAIDVTAATAGVVAGGIFQADSVG